MFKKIMTQLFIFSLLFLTWWNTEELKQALPTSGRISGPRPVFPNLQINLLQSADPFLVRDALEATTASLIDYISPELADEPWEAHYLFLNLLGNEDPELAIALSLPPDRGILTIIQKQNEQYVLYYFLKNLLPLAQLHKLPMPGGTDILVTREDHNERMGAYTESREVKLWSWQGASLQTVWNEYSFWELNWLNTWQNQQAQPKKWFKLVQDLTVTYQSSSLPEIRLEGEQYHYASPATEKEVLPAPYEFELLAQRRIENVYRWHEDWQRFILGTGMITGSDGRKKRVAVLKDMATQLESLALPEHSELCQVIDEQGRISLVKKQDLTLVD